MEKHIEIRGCIDCPLVEEEREQDGVSYYVCRLFDQYTDKNTHTLNQCPIGKNKSITITIMGGKKIEYINE